MVASILIATDSYMIVMIFSNSVLSLDSIISPVHVSCHPVGRVFRHHIPLESNLEGAHWRLMISRGVGNVLLILNSFFSSDFFFFFFFMSKHI